MPEGLEFGLEPERIDEGSLEESAAFGLFSVRSAQRLLTEGFDHFLNGYRRGPLVSGYHAAEWLAWNWWRLRWEPRSPAPDWAFAHKMSTIGEGYVWPNLEIWSDGTRTTLISRPSSRPDEKPFRYVGSTPTIVPSSLYERAVDEFIPRVLGRLRDEGVADTNLDRLWRDVLAERADPDVAKRRRLEALMGREPDGVDEHVLDGLVADSARLGSDAVDEIAAERARPEANKAGLLTAESLNDIAQTAGHAASRRDALVLREDAYLSTPANVPAWRLGAEAAGAVRLQEVLGSAPLSNDRLAQMAGVRPSVLAEQAKAVMAPISYALDEDGGVGSRIVLQARHENARRFALARVVGDRLLYHAGALHPATRAYTYRQKAQRSFAAELLAPFEAVEGMMRGDYSEECQIDVAEYFSVSPMLINTLLLNHDRIESDLLEESPRPAAA